METEESRTSLLIGEMGLQRLKQSCVLVLGVGGDAAEADVAALL